MIKVIIAEDQRMLRGALGSLLDLEEDITIIGLAENGKEALSMINSQKPDVCLIDIEMPIMSGLEVAEQLMVQESACRVIILTTFARPGYLERALKANAYGYLLKDGPSEDLAQSIRNVMQGKREISPELIFGSLKLDNPLTEREIEILKLASSGMTTKEIAGVLFLSPGTIRNYLSEVINKLEAKNRIEAIAIAEGKGWI